jgi:hypothetical protein
MRLKRVLAVLLYIKGHKDVVAQVHPGSKPIKPKPYRSGQLGPQPTVYNVGDRYAYVIEHWEDESVQHTDEINEGGKAVKPHWRRPHPHLYHTKEGPVIHFLGPICVKGAAWDLFDPDKPQQILVK